RNHDFVVTGEGVTAASRLRVRPLDHVHGGPVLAKKIEIHGGKVAQLAAQIADGGNGFQKNFRHHHRGARINIDSALVQLSNHGTKQAEIEVGCDAESGGVAGGVSVRRIGPEGDMDSN